MILRMDEQDGFLDGLAVTLRRHHRRLDIMRLADLLAAFLDLLLRGRNVARLEHIAHGLDDHGAARAGMKDELHRLFYCFFVHFFYP